MHRFEFRSLVKSLKSLCSISLTSFFIFLLASPFIYSEEIDLPILIDIGIGPALVEFNTPVGAVDQSLYGVKLELAGMVEEEALKLLKDEIPKDVPSWMLKGRVAVSPWWVPSTLYVTPGDENLASIYGIRFAPDLGLGISLGPIILHGKAGIDLTYLYMDSNEFTDHHFLRPGVHAAYEVAIEPVKYIQFTIGQDFQRYWGQSLSNGETLKSAKETYFRVNIRIPYSIKAKL